MEPKAQIENLKNENNSQHLDLEIVGAASGDDYWRDKHLTVMERYECKFCPIYYDNPHALLGHVNRYHKGAKKTDIPIYDKYIEKVVPKKAPKKAQNYASRSSSDRYMCKACADDFDNYHEFKIHVQQVHNKKNTFVLCEICRKMCVTIGALTYHKNSWHKDFPSKYKCRLCGNSYDNERSYITHMRTLHNQNLPNGTHHLVKRVARDNEDSDVENITPSRRYKKQKLESEIPRKLKAKPPNVNKRSERLMLRNKNQQNVTKETRIRKSNTVAAKKQRKASAVISNKFDCKLCTKSYSQAISLTNHEWIMHRDVIKYHDERCDSQFECRFCPIICESDFTLIAHVKKIHADETSATVSIFDHYLIFRDKADASFQCNECDIEFSNFHTFKLHVYKQYLKNLHYVECEVCHEFVTSAFGLIAHRQAAHPDHYGTAVGPKLKKIFRNEPAKSFDADILPQPPETHSNLMQDHQTPDTGGEKSCEEQECFAKEETSLAKQSTTDENENIGQQPTEVTIKQEPGEQHKNAVKKYLLQKNVYNSESGGANLPKKKKAIEFHCKFCQYPFDTNKLLLAHEQSHTERVKIYCTPCGETFFTKYLFDLHEKEIHSWN